MKLSILRSLSVAILGASLSLVPMLALYGHDCSWNSTVLNCSTSQQNQYNTCVNCTVAGYLCSQNTGKYYNNSTGVMTYQSVAVGSGTIRFLNSKTWPTNCWYEYQCTNTVVLDKTCLASGCSNTTASGQSASGMYCNQCGQGALVPGGTYNVADNSSWEFCTGS